MLSLAAFLSLVFLFFLFGLLLGIFAQKFRQDSENPLIQQIDNLLPQSQCGQCGFAGCKPYAQAIAENKANINLCPPGGRELVEKLADLLGIDIPEDEFTEENPEEKVAFIVEDWCIGCAKCIKSCPVDAILGSNKKIHTIIADECTGCNLCTATCPTSCIKMLARNTPDLLKKSIAKQIDKQNNLQLTEDNKND